MMHPRGAAAAPAARVHSFDHLKAWAIVAVVFTHAGPDSFTPSGPGGVWFLSKVWTAFHVPSFLFVSGFLCARSRPISAAGLTSRLVRLLLPYLVASGLALLLVVPPSTPGAALYALLTGSAFGIYYYVFAFTLCLLATVPLSWLSRRTALALWALYTLYSLAASLEPSLRLSHDLFWLVRNPLDIYTLGFFLSGWLAALYGPELARLASRAPAALPLAAGAAALLGAGMESGVLPFALEGLNRVPYTFGVIGLFVWLTRARPAGAATYLLSEATLGIYLYHFFFVSWLRPTADALGPWPGFGLLLAAGLLGGVGVVWGARRLLGEPRGRHWVGA